MSAENHFTAPSGKRSTQTISAPAGSQTEATKCAIISGGSRGIGRACALRFAKAGYNVDILFGGNEAAAQETLSALRKTAPGGRFMALQADVADEAALHEAASKVLDEFGRIDTAVACAGISKDALLVTTKAEDFDRTLDVNLRGTFCFMKEVFRPMMKQRSGRIVTISSVTGLHGNAGQAAYAASKAGITGLTKTAALEGAKRGILVNAIAPGYVITDMTEALPEKVREAMVSRIPLGRGAAPEEIAEAVFFLGSEANTYITGQTLTIAGGMFT